MPNISRNEVIEKVRSFVNRLTEKEFLELRKAASEGWKSLSCSSDRLPSEDSLADMIPIIRKLELEYGNRLPKLIADRGDYKQTTMVFFAVNERYMADTPKLDDLDTD
jgi:hypothetical protein